MACQSSKRTHERHYDLGMMYDSIALFLGCPIDDHLENELQAVDPKILNLFLQSDEYLTKIVYNDMNFLGKYTNTTSNSSELTLLQDNIYSILKKVLPKYPFENKPLVLFPFTPIDL